MEASVGQIPVAVIVAVIIVGLVIGSLMILVVLGKYAIHQWFHLVGGPLLSTLGVVLLGLSILGNVQLKLGEFEATFSRLQADLRESRQENTVLLARLSESSERLIRFTRIASTISNLPFDSNVRPENFDQIEWTRFTEKLRTLSEIKAPVPVFKKMLDR